MLNVFFSPAKEDLFCSLNSGVGCFAKTNENPELYSCDVVESNKTEEADVFIDKMKKLYAKIQESDVLIDVSSFVTVLVFVVGLASNLIAIKVLSSKKFNRMAFSLQLIIICLLNILSLCGGMVKFNTLVLDRSSPNNEYHSSICIVTIWFTLMVDRTKDFCIAALLYNRIKAQKQIDRFDSVLDAARIPTLLTLAAFLICNMPVSQFCNDLHEDIIDKIGNQYFCTALFIGLHIPLRVEVITVTLFRYIPIIQIGIICFLLIIWLFAVLLRLRKNRLAIQATKENGEIDERSSIEAASHLINSLNISIFKVARYSVNLRKRINLIKKNNPKDTTYNTKLFQSRINLEDDGHFSEINLIDTTFEFSELEKDMNKIALNFAVLHILIDEFLHIAGVAVSKEYLAENDGAFQFFLIIILSELVQNINLCSTFALFSFWSKSFKEEAIVLWFEVDSIRAETTVLSERIKSSAFSNIMSFAKRRDTRERPTYQSIHLLQRNVALIEDFKLDDSMFTLEKLVPEAADEVRDESVESFEETEGGSETIFAPTR